MASLSIEIQIWGEGPVSLFRDGQRFEGSWSRTSAEDMMSFLTADGNILTFKPGNTWFEVVPIGFDRLTNGILIVEELDLENMKQKRHLSLAALLMATLFFTACSSEPEYAPTPTPTPANVVESAQPASTQAAPSAGDASNEETAQQIAPSGPDFYPENVNPLTGLTVSDPAALTNPPLIVRVSNSPSVVRPQSGLNSADHVWEHVVEGFALTRFSAVFLGESPDYVGSVRSGRPPDFELVPMYGAIYYASGFSTNKNDPEGPPRMRELMRACPLVQP